MDEQPTKMFPKSSVDSLKKRLQERNFDKYYSFDKCLQVLSGEIRRYHRGGMSVEEIVEAINADFSLVSKSDVIKVLTQKEPATPRRSRKKRKIEAVSDERPQYPPVSTPVSSQSNVVQEHKNTPRGSGSGRFEMLDYNPDNL